MKKLFIGFLFAANLFATATSDLTDFAPSVSGGTLTIQPGVHRFGHTQLCVFSGTSTALINSMSGPGGIAEVYLSSSCAIVLEFPVTNVITFALGGTPPMTAAAVSVPQVPFDGWWIGEVTISTSAITAVTNKRAQSGTDIPFSGFGMKIDYTRGAYVLNVDPAIIPTVGGVNVFTGFSSFYNAELQAPVGNTDPVCTATTDIGKIWFDNTSSTTAVKFCKSVSGTVGWSTVTTTP